MKKVIFFSLILLPLILIPLLVIRQKVNLLSRAEEKTANILVNPAIDQGPIIPVWQSLAQGGEEKYPFAAVSREITDLKPKYIRIDHLYDFYNVVDKVDNRLIFNWQEADVMVDQIRQTGALPFLSLSYMPLAIAKNNNLTDEPADWQDWQEVVRATIQHYSGINERNLNNVIYEVWNEPDLFGNWKIGSGKDYRLLYRHAVLGANQTTNTNPFKIGGPGITAPYLNWVNYFLDYVVQNNLRIDFYSWHRYSLKPTDFLQDIDKVDHWLFSNGGYSLEKYLTEWGPDSENSSLNDGNFAAAHLIATIRNLLQRLEMTYIFEIKDGPSPEGKKYWGRWGLLTHEKAGAVEKKPKYYALELLNKMSGSRISLTGEGTKITGFAVKEKGIIRLLLVNLDLNNQYFENVPVNIINLTNGQYNYREYQLSGGQPNQILTVDGQIFSRQIPLGPNQAVMIELEKI